MVRRMAVVLGVSTLAIAALAAPAWAHVTVAPASAEKGAADVEITFRVPNEEDSATTKVQVALPTSPPLVGVLAQAVPGWTAKVVTQHLTTAIHTDDGDVSDVVSQITWTATSADSGIKPNSFQKFEILVGQLPEDADQIVFKAIQTYANGDVVPWIDPVTPNGPEAEHPTPILQLTGPSGSTPTTAAPAGTTTASTSTKDSSARAIGIVALVVGALALLAATATLMRKRRTT